MKKYLIISTFMIFFMSFKQQQQDSAKIKNNAKIKEDSIRKADLAEIKRRLSASQQNPSQKDISKQFKPIQTPKSEYIYKDGRIVGGKTTIFKN